MLSNKDFASLVTAPANEKVRFDYKQIAAWDKEIDGKSKRHKVTAKRNPDDSKLQKDQERIAPVYRDRAQERRKDVRSAEDAALESIASKLNPEQTKFLGGDVEHTHLVKGLDYALLQKLRDGAAQQPLQHQVVSEIASVPLGISTTLGRNLKELLLASCREPAPTGASNRRQIPLVGVSFEFPMSSTDEDEVIDAIPTMVTRTTKEVDCDTTSMTSVISSDLLIRLGAALTTKITVNSTKRKRLEEDTGVHVNLHDNPGRAAKWSDCNDIYSGIIDVASDTSNANSSLLQLSSCSTATAKGVFDGLSVKPSCQSLEILQPKDIFPMLHELSTVSSRQQSRSLNKQSILVKEDDSYAIYSDKYADDDSIGGSDNDEVSRPPTKSSRRQELNHSTTNRAARRAAAKLASAQH